MKIYCFRFVCLCFSVKQGILAWTRFHRPKLFPSQRSLRQKTNRNRKKNTAKQLVSRFAFPSFLARLPTFRIYLCKSASNFLFSLSLLRYLFLICFRIMFLFVDDELKHRQVDKLVFDWEVGKKNERKKKMDEPEWNVLKCREACKSNSWTKRRRSKKKKWNLRITLLSHGLKFLILVYTETI